MADSLRGLILLPAMSQEVYDACNFPFTALRSVDQDGVTGDAFQRWLSGKGLASPTKFKVRGVWLGGPASGRLAGYELAVNPPTCTVGNNVLLVNGVPRACELAVLLLKNWLRARGCTYQGVDMLDFEDMLLLSVTPTFLHKMGSQGEAKEARTQFYLATTIRNVKSVRGENSVKPALTVGDTDDNTAYLHQRDHSLSAYVKDRETKVVAVFPDKATKDMIFNEGEQYLRLEPELNAVWLRKNGLDRVEAWRLYGAEVAYQKAYGVLRKDLRLDENLRSRKPKDQDIAKLAPVDQEVLCWHLAAGPKQSTRDHPAFSSISSKLARQKYFSAMKLRILERLRLDISIPWIIQAAAAGAGVPTQVRHYPGMLSVTRELATNIFSPASVPEMLHTLNVRLDRDRPRSIGRTHIAPQHREPPLVPLGQLTVTNEARAHLDSCRQPLHQFLDAHKCGVFGDVSRDEVLALTRAAVEMRPVASRFNVNGKQIIVRTARLGQGDCRLSMTNVSLAP